MVMKIPKYVVPLPKKFQCKFFAASLEGFNLTLTGSSILMASDLRYIIKFFFNDSHKAVNFLISS